MPDEIYCYKNSDVLKNKMNIQNENKLIQAEIELVSNRLFELQQNPVKGRFDFKHLCEIHQRIFQDIYDWSGKTRTVNIGKGNLFCLVQHIPTYADSIFNNCAKDCIKVKNNKAQFVHILTKYYADINALHPFREGNGRTQREFARELCLECGYIFDLTNTCHQEMLEASITSFDNGDNSKLEQIFTKTIIPIEEYTNLKQAIESKLLILSKDDIPETNNNRPLPYIDTSDYNIEDEDDDPYSNKSNK